METHMGLNYKLSLVLYFKLASFFVWTVHPLHNGDLSAARSHHWVRLLIPTHRRVVKDRVAGLQSEAPVLNRGTTTGKYSLLVMLFVMLCVQRDTPPEYIYINLQYVTMLESNITDDGYRETKISVLGALATELCH